MAKRLAFVALLAPLALAACEIQPPPKKQPEPPPAQPQAAKPVEPPAPAAGAADAGVADAAKIEVTPACLQVAAKLAQVFVDSASDPAQKSIYEQDRANMIRKMSEACSVQGWSENAHNCFLAAKTRDDIAACEKKFPGRPPRQPPPSAGGLQPANP